MISSMIQKKLSSSRPTYEERTKVGLVGCGWVVFREDVEG